MTRKTTRRSNARKPAAQKLELTPRAMLLAGIGAVSLGRKQAQASLEALAANAEDLRARADDAAREAGARVAKLRKQAQTRLAPVQKQAEAFARQAEQQFETTVAPVLAKFGVATQAKARRAPARRAKPAARRTRKA
jgi:DNA anti-recombination protein RmuC